MIRRRRMVLACGAVLLLAACGSDDQSQDRGGDAIASAASDGERLPDVRIETLATGEPSSLADIEGPAVVNLWATWCAPCRAEIPDFETVHQERGDEVRFVGINIGEGGDRALDFLDEVGATYDQFLDPEGFVVTELRTSTMPVTIVLDANGVISERHLGPLDRGGLNEAIDGALAVS